MRVKLAEAFDLQMGKTPDRNDPSCWRGDHKWVSIADLTKAGKYITDTKESITDLGVAKSGIKAVPANTVIMSFKLSIGKTAITTEEIYTNEAIMAFIDKGIYEIDTDYIYHLFSAKDWGEGTNKAVLGLTLNKATLSQIEIEIPSIEIQRQVVTVLDKVDALISLRKKQMQKLDDLVKSRFVEMFGDPGINPYNWIKTTIGDECYYIKDGPHASPTYIEGKDGIPFISTRNIVNGSGIDWETAKYISVEDYQECIKKCRPEKGDILYSKGGTTGIARLVETDRKFANWVHVAVLKFGPQLNGKFFECMLNSDYCYEQSQRLTRGIANRDFVLSSIAKVEIVVPPIEKQQEFVTFVKHVDSSRLTICNGLNKMKLLKKTLMQKYFG